MVQLKSTPSPIDDKNRIDIGFKFDKLLDDVGKQTYQSIVGALLYADLGTQPDIAFAVSALSRHYVKPMTSHLSASR